MPGDIAKEIEALQEMTTSELAERYQQLHGQPVRTRHRAYLIRKVAWRISTDTALLDQVLAEAQATIDTERSTLDSERREARVIGHGVRHDSR